MIRKLRISFPTSATIDSQGIGGQSDKVNLSFKPNSRFDDVIALYNFDRELRLLIFDVIERIEIGLRTKLIYHLSHEIDPWWFQNTDLFINVQELVKTLNSIAENVEISKQR